MITFKKFLLEQNLGNLIGAAPGGVGGNWGGSMPKLISLLPMGNWKASSLKRPKQVTASGGISDHWEGSTNAYAADFGLNTTFKNDVNAATNFAIAIARNGGQNISSWQPYVGKELSFNTQDGFRVQIIWQSNVGGNHYDHVHVGVRAGAGATLNGVNGQQPQDQQTSTTPSQEYGSVGKAAAALFQGAQNIFSGSIQQPQ